MEQELSLLKEAFEQHQHTGIDSVDLDIPRLPSDLELTDDLLLAPLPTIAQPSGGTVIDSQSRNAINSLIARLQSLGLIS